MQRIFSALGQVLRNCILILGLVSVIGLSGLFISINQPSYAAVALAQNQAQEEAIDVLNYSDQPAQSREEAYEAAAEASTSPEKVLKAEEKEIKDFRTSQGKGLVGGAQDLLNKVTGNE